MNGIEHAWSKLGSLLAITVTLSGCSGTWDPVGNGIDIEFHNDTANTVVLVECHFGGKDSQIGSDCGGFGEDVRIPADGAEMAYPITDSAWRIKGTQDCLLVIHDGSQMRSVEVSNARSCKALTADYVGGLCPDSASEDGWWHAPGKSEDEAECERNRRKAEKRGS